MSKTTELVERLRELPRDTRKATVEIYDLCIEASYEIEELTDRCARYAEGIAVLQERQRWIPVTERLPEDSVKECIIFVPHIPENIVGLGRYLGSGRWVLDGWYLTPEAVVYWMPLPEGPHEKALETMK